MVRGSTIRTPTDPPCHVGARPAWSALLWRTVAPEMCADYSRLPAIPQTNCKPFAESRPTAPGPVPEARAARGRCEGPRGRRRDGSATATCHCACEGARTVLRLNRGRGVRGQD